LCVFEGLDSHGPFVLGPLAEGAASRGEERLNGAGELLGLARELAPGDADDAPAGEHELLVAAAIMLEGPAGAVGGAAVGLDDQPLLAPEEVRLGAASVGEPDPYVDLRPGEAGAVGGGSNCGVYVSVIRPTPSVDDSLAGQTQRVSAQGAWKWHGVP
jgi:hypothetical protein